MAPKPSKRRQLKPEGVTMTAHKRPFGRRLLEKGVTLLEESRKALKLFRQFVEIANNNGKPFEPVPYDYDSLENRDPVAIDRVLRMVAEPMEQYFQAEVDGLEHLKGGPVLFVGNHSGGSWSPEIFLFGSALFRRHGLDALPFGLAHETICLIPPVARILIPIGAVRASPENAARVFASERNVLVYPGGDEEAFRPSRLRDKIVFSGRRGYIRLALRHGVPIMPVVTFGAHDVFVVLDDGNLIASRLGLNRVARLKIFPTVLSVPWGVTTGIVMPFIPLPARIRIEVLAPIYFARQGDAAAQDERYVDECDREVRACMQVALTGMAQRLRGGNLQSPFVHELLQTKPDNDQWRPVEQRAMGAGLR